MASPVPVPADPPGDTANQGDRGTLVRLWQRLMSTIVQVIYLRFRYDIFISYRRHYKPYVLKLKQQLEHLGYRAFVDEEECPPGSALNQTLERALVRSAALVLLGTEDVDSAYVTKEVSIFSATGRTIIPVDVAGALARSRIVALSERDLVWVDEAASALSIGVPSPAVLAGIEANFRYLRRNLRQRIEAVLIAGLVVLIAGGSVRYAQQNVSAARAQEQKATRQATSAQAKAATAAKAEEAATAAATAADERRTEAERLEAAARRATYEELGERAAVLAVEPGREHEALLAGVLAVGPPLRAGQPPPIGAIHGLSEAVAAAARSMPMPAGGANDARVLADNNRIVSVAADGVRWWNSGTGTLIRHVPVSVGSGQVAFCGDSGLVTVDTQGPSSTTAREVQLWDIETMRRSRRISLDSSRSVSVCSRDGRWAVVAGNEPHLWDLQRGTDIGPVLVGLDPKFSADGSRLLSGTGLVEIPSRRVIAHLVNPLRTPTARAPTDFQFVSFFDSDRRIAAASDLGNVTFWAADDGALQGSFAVVAPRHTVLLFADQPRLHPAIASMSVSPDGTQLAIADIDSRITIWGTNPVPTKPFASLEVLTSEDAPIRTLIDLEGQSTSSVVTSIQFLDGGRVAFSTDRGRVSVRSALNLSRLVSVQDPECARNVDRARKPRFTVSRNQLELVVFGCFAGLRRWSFADSWDMTYRDHARLVFRGDGIGEDIEGAAFGNDARTIVTRIEERGLAAWDRDTGERLRLVPPATGRLRLLSPASTTVSGAMDGARLGPEEVNKGTRSPSGRFVVSRSRDPAAVWDTAEGRRLITMRLGSFIVQFAPDERDVVTFAAARSLGGRRSYAVYSLDPAWYLRRACSMLAPADRERTAAWCGPA